MKESIVRLRALEKQRFAYRYALNVVDFDAETVAPEGSADGRAEACEVLSRADFDLLVNDNTAALLRQAAQDAETEQERAEVRELQRAYDQILHDVCLQNVPVIFAIDRAGLVGSDGETHQGIFDLSFLSSIPNMHIMAPKNKWELSDMMKFAYDFKGPIAIRYPRGEAYDGLADKRADVEMGKSEMLFEEEKIALFAVGSMVKTAVEVREALKEKGISCTVVNARFVKPIDENMVRYLAKNHDLIVPMEENVASGGLSEKVITLVEQEKLPIEVLPITIPDEYVEHGNVDILKQEIGISTSAVLEKIEKELEAK